MAMVDRRVSVPDRRRVPRGGRRPYDVPGKHPPVLIADTDESVRRAFVRYLDHFGFRVAQAARIDDHLADDDGSRPDLIVAELTSAAAAKLASSPSAPTIVTVTDDLHAAPRYAAAMLVKPFPLPTLLDEMRRVLREHTGTGN